MHRKVIIEEWNLQNSSDIYCSFKMSILKVTILAIKFSWKWWIHDACGNDGYIHYVHINVLSHFFGKKFLITFIPQHSVEKYCKTRGDHDFYGKINNFSVKSTFLLKKLINVDFTENFCASSNLIVLFHRAHVILQVDFTKYF